MSNSSTASIPATEKNETLHTPGPWQCDENKDYSSIGIFAPRSASSIGHVYNADDFLDVEDDALRERINETARADAHLIAAAPELLELCLEALKLCLAHHGENHYYSRKDELAGKLRAALRKVAGGFRSRPLS